MKRIRWWTVALLVLLTVVYSVEYSQFSPQSGANLGSYASLLVFAAVVITLLVPAMGRVRVYYVLVLWAAVYVIGRAFLFPNIPLFGGMLSLFLIAELAMLVLGVTIAHRVAGALREFEAAVEQVAVPDPERWVVRIEGAASAIKTEVNRSRRYKRPLSVVVVEPVLDTPGSGLARIFHEVQRGLARHYAVVNLGRMLKIDLRRTDVVALEDRSRGRFIVLCPETDTAGVEVLVDRMKLCSQRQLGFSIVCGTAQFPQDAITFEDVVGIAMSRVPRPGVVDSAMPKHDGL